MICGETIVLKPFDRIHWPATREWMNDPELARLLDRTTPVSDAEHDAWCEGLRNRRDAVFFAVETRETREHIGNVWLWDVCGRNQKAELRIVIGMKERLSRGAGSEAIHLACQYAFQRLNLQRVYAYVLGGNVRAIRAFEKAGFTLEGTLRRDRWGGDDFVDVHVAGRLRGDAGAPKSAETSG